MKMLKKFSLKFIQNAEGQIIVLHKHQSKKLNENIISEPKLTKPID